MDDDDGGRDVETTSVRVLTPEQAVIEVIARANNALAAVAVLDTSANWLTTAQQDGANVSVEIALVKQISAALGG